MDEGEVAATHEFEQGRALAVGDGAIYVATGDTLWAMDVESGELDDCGTLAARPEGMA